MDIENIINTLTFLKTHVFTPANINRAAELGNTLGGILADAYALVDEMSAQAEAGTRSLELERRIEEAGLTAIVRDLQQLPF